MKIFASDLDGTLLNKDYQSDARIDACIQTIANHKDKFVIVTGRSFNGIENLSFIKNADFSIVLNGAIILDNQFKVLKKTLINQDVIEAIYNEYRYDNIEYISDKHIYMTISKEKYLKEYADWDLWRKKLTVEKELNHHLSIFKFDCRLADIQDVIKINILELDPVKYKEKETFILQFDKTINNQPFDDHVFELTSMNSSKLKALKYLCKVNGWCEDDVYVFGDGGNDVEMLSYFKHSYALADASDQAKRAASEIVDTNEHYGVCNKILSLLN